MREGVNVCVSHASNLKCMTMQQARLQRWTVIFLPLLTVRLISAFYSNIADCDETFNFWEPLHYLLHGAGFQTWEYSPAYGIRSYAYIALHSLPLLPLTAFAKEVQFYCLRAALAGLCAVCETIFIRSVTKATGVRVGLVLWLVMLTSCGMFSASAAFLPSSFCMYCTMIAFGAWMSNRPAVAVLATALGALLAWPFSAVLGVPIALDVVLLQKRLPGFLGWSVASLALILGPVVAIDYHYYGRILCTPLNIVLYNVFGVRGPELYGTEPWSYYLLNGALNFNVLFPVALAAPLLALMKLVQGGMSGSTNWSRSGHKHSCGMLLALVIWLMIFMTRPHKEERFLFPVYPLLCFAATYGMERMEDVLVYLSGWSHWRVKSMFMPAVMATIFIHGLLSVSRILALFQGYHAPLGVYPQLRDIQHKLGPGAPTPLNLCVGKEWYRYPSSFLLPSHRWRLRFVPSEFRAQLPQPFVAPPPQGTRVIPSHFNDLNEEEPSQYFDISQCHFLVDLDIPRATSREPRYSLDTQHWEVVVRQPFLDAIRSHKFFRAFYIPWLSPKLCQTADYVVLRNRKHSTQQM